MQLVLSLGHQKATAQCYYPNAVLNAGLFQAMHQQSASQLPTAKSPPFSSHLLQTKHLPPPFLDVLELRPIVPLMDPPRYHQEQDDHPHNPRLVNGLSWPFVDCDWSSFSFSDGLSFMRRE